MEGLAQPLQMGFTWVVGAPPERDMGCNRVAGIYFGAFTVLLATPPVRAISWLRYF
jgi:hypothetical protein